MRNKISNRIYLVMKTYCFLTTKSIVLLWQNLLSASTDLDLSKEWLTEFCDANKGLLLGKYYGYFYGKQQPNLQVSMWLVIRMLLWLDDVWCLPFFPLFTMPELLVFTMKRTWADVEIAWAEDHNHGWYWTLKTYCCSSTCKICWELGGSTLIINPENKGINIMISYSYQILCNEILWRLKACVRSLNCCIWHQEWASWLWLTMR